MSSLQREMTNKEVPLAQLTSASKVKVMAFICHQLAEI
jgi:hypothetical protein